MVNPIYTDVARIWCKRIWRMRPLWRRSALIETWGWVKTYSDEMNIHENKILDIDRIMHNIHDFYFYGFVKQYSINSLKKTTTSIIQITSYSIGYQRAWFLTYSRIESWELSSNMWCDQQELDIQFFNLHHMLFLTKKTSILPAIMEIWLVPARIGYSDSCRC